jgi:hypothetical protein
MGPRIIALTGRRRFTPFWVVLIAAALAAASASAASAKQQSASADFAVGGGTYLLDLPDVLQRRVHFSFSARSDDASPLTAAATGRFLWRDPLTDQFIKGRVICLVVQGGEAFIVSEIVDSDDPTLIGLVAGAQIIDGGLPGSQGDRFHLEFVSFPFPGMCDISTDPFTFEVVSGSVRVYDAPE